MTKYISLIVVVILVLFSCEFSQKAYFVDNNLLIKYNNQSLIRRTVPCYCCSFNDYVDSIYYIISHDTLNLLLNKYYLCKNSGGFVIRGEGTEKDHNVYSTHFPIVLNRFESFTDTINISDEDLSLLSLLDFVKISYLDSSYGYFIESKKYHSHVDDRNNELVRKSTFFIIPISKEDNK